MTIISDLALRAAVAVDVASDTLALTWLLAQTVAVRSVTYHDKFWKTQGMTATIAGAQRRRVAS